MFVVWIIMQENHTITEKQYNQGLNLYLQSEIRATFTVLCGTSCVGSGT